MSRANERRKHKVLIEYAERFKTKVFVETGTYRGDTVKAMLLTGLFREIHTIDIHQERYQLARRRYESHCNVYCWHGDSAKKLPDVLTNIKPAALFWLDAHYSGKQNARKGVPETPIIAELNVVLNRSADDVILIDDARFFRMYPKKYPKSDYPRLAQLEEMVRDRCPGRAFENTDDVIRITPCR